MLLRDKMRTARMAIHSKFDQQASLTCLLVLTKCNPVQHCVLAMGLTFPFRNGKINRKDVCTSLANAGVHTLCFVTTIQS